MWCEEVKRVLVSGLPYFSVITENSMSRINIGMGIFQPYIDGSTMR